MTRPMELHIQEIVLHGFPRMDYHQVREALQQQLTMLLTQKGLGSSFCGGDRLPYLEGGQFFVPANAGVGDMANRMAGTIYDSLSQSQNHTGGKRS